MTTGEGFPNRPPADLLGLLDQACHRAGYPPGARLLRHFANAVYLLDGAPVVARIGYGAGATTKAMTSIAVIRELIQQDFPAVVPADLPSGVDQPMIFQPSSYPVVVTFWRYYPQPAGIGWPDTRALGHIASRLHELPIPSVDLHRYQPLRSLTATLADPAARLAVTDHEHAWLTDRINELCTAFNRLDFPLGRGLVHSDLYVGNLLWSIGGHSHSVVLGDWDSVSVGPREVDLIPTYAEPRFGTDPATVDAFARAYGYDLRLWDGYDVLYDIRELSTLTALIRLAPGDGRLKDELTYRLRLLISGNRTTLWHGQ